MPKTETQVATQAPAGLDFGVQIPFVSHLGFVLTRCADGQSEITFTACPEHLNSYGVTHGGALMTLLDVTMAMAARADMPQVGVVTIEMKTSFMRPSHGPLVARGKLLHRTATLAFTEATVFDQDGKACAHATGTFKTIKRLPTSARSVQDWNRPSLAADA
ncbi:PaaI family thioesterase [Rhodoferax sp.]|uniref:PaaI family thioesterase n=1 Tax=Rhodoferax sp. TaxID=50421 RepID=UPI002608D939|nr:PaaI family thioesterase [Rhodoferax sp.]MDD2811108.1 PaaI family thioesterase [Rhodoferax sp.]MDD4942969.1 PaaI family thioesterase [Rhodoferax sp.]